MRTRELERRGGVWRFEAGGECALPWPSMLRPPLSSAKHMKGSKNYRENWRCTGAWEITKIDEMGARRRNGVGRWPGGPLGGVVGCWQLPPPAAPFGKFWAPIGRCQEKLCGEGTYGSIDLYLSVHGAWPLHAARCLAALLVKNLRLFQLLRTTPQAEKNTFVGPGR